jgi:hypothetical protein
VGSVREVLMIGESGRLAQRLLILGLGSANAFAKVTKFVISSMFCGALAGVRSRA